MKKSANLNKIIVTNDDGIESPFLWILVASLKTAFDVRVVAPLTEQSWIGKAISRRRLVNVMRHDREGVTAWSVEGTPADCINIALGNLFRDEPIAAVVSGVNIGYNASLATVLSSGTVGAALEATLMGVPGIALSKSLDRSSFEQLQRDRTTIASELRQSLISDCERVVDFVKDAIVESASQKTRSVVYNYNFPFHSDESTKVQQTRLANTRAAGIFTESDLEGNAFEFRYQEGENIDLRTKTDLNCLSEGHISYTLIDYTRLT